MTRSATHGYGHPKSGRIAVMRSCQSSIDLSPFPDQTADKISQAQNRQRRIVFLVGRRISPRIASFENLRWAARNKHFCGAKSYTCWQISRWALSMASISAYSARSGFSSSALAVSASACRAVRKTPSGGNRSAVSSRWRPTPLSVAPPLEQAVGRIVPLASSLVVEIRGERARAECPRSGDRRRRADRCPAGASASATA